MHTQIYTFVIFCSLKYKIFEVDFLHVCGIHHWLHLKFFHYFFKLVNIYLIFMQKKEKKNIYSSKHFSAMGNLRTEFI